MQHLGVAWGTRGAQRDGVHRRLGTSLGGLTLKVGGALESEESRSWLGLSFMVGVRGQVSPGSGNSSGGLRYSSSEVIGLLKGDVDPPGGKTDDFREKRWRELAGACYRDEAAPAGPALTSPPGEARLLCVCDHAQALPLPESDSSSAKRCQP